jgi:hypothetical protein
VNPSPQKPFGGFSEIHDLLQASLQGNLTDGDHERLEYLVCQNDAARRMYVSYLTESISLRRWAAEPAIAVARANVRNFFAELSEQFWMAARSVCTRTSLIWLSIGLVASAVEVAVLLALLAPRSPQSPVENVAQLATTPTDPSTEETPAASVNSAVAKLLRESNARWVQAENLKPGDALIAETSYELLSGMVEIEFGSGTRMIVQGPASWTPIGPMVSRLHLGRLTARVPKQAHGFEVETPQGKVIDLGTEFAVEVGPRGDSFVHVFEGKVQAVCRAAVDGNPTAAGASQHVLVEGESTYLGPAMTITTEAPVDQVARFTRWMPAPGRFPLFATGRGLAEGATDPHWSVAHESDPNRWQMALVAKPHAEWRSNDRYWSQWISTSADGQEDLPVGRYTFRTQFDLTGFDERAAQIIGHWMADNLIEQIYLNGTPLWSAPQKHNMQEFTHFTIKQGFVPGINVIDFVVVNEEGAPNPIGFRLDWHGIALPSNWKNLPEVSASDDASQLGGDRQ